MRFGDLGSAAGPAVQSEHESIVMGDGANELKMMDIAGMSVAFAPSPVVRIQPTVVLNFVGLNAILNLFG